MPRFVLLYRGKGDPPPDEQERIRTLPGMRVIEQELPRLWLVDAPEAPLRALIDQLGSWAVSPERSYDV